jgi:hypothetical protein
MRRSYFYDPEEQDGVGSCRISRQPILDQSLRKGLRERVHTCSLALSLLAKTSNPSTETPSASCPWRSCPTLASSINPGEAPDSQSRRAQQSERPSSRHLAPCTDSNEMLI